MTVELTRRFFLGGAISAIVVASSVPTARALMNQPTIYADGLHDDSGGFGALFRGEPVIFPTENISIDEYKKVFVHEGSYRIDMTVDIPFNSTLELEKGCFIPGKALPLNSPLFMSSSPSHYKVFKENPRVLFFLDNANRTILVDMVGSEEIPTVNEYLLTLKKIELSEAAKLAEEERLYREEMERYREQHKHGKLDEDVVY